MQGGIASSTSALAGAEVSIALLLSGLAIRGWRRRRQLKSWTAKMGSLN